MSDTVTEHRPFTGDTLIIATHNKGKVPEIAALLDGKVPTLTTAGELGFKAPEETGTTFIENASIKAVAAAKAGGLPALADDSGLAVDSLDGAPGVYTADWAECDREGNPLEERNWELAMTKVHEAMEASGRIENGASFICALALAWPDGHVEVVEGRCPGTITWPMRGDKGFGYDPIFVPADFDQTFAEIDPAQKQVISHRADAFKKLKAICFKG